MQTTSYTTHDADDLKIIVQLQAGELDFTKRGAEAEWSASAIGNPGKATAGVAFLPISDGETIIVTADIFIPAGVDPDEIYLLDTESTNASTGTSPGLRVVLKSGRLAVDAGKIGINEVWLADPPDFATDAWNTLIFAVEQGDESDGRMQLFLNGQLVLDKQRATRLTQEVLNQYGMILEGGDLDRVQFGITATMNSGMVSMLTRNVQINAAGREFEITSEMLGYVDSKKQCR